MPYIFYPTHLAEQMDTEEEICVAFLHDVIEDTDITIEALKEEGFSDKILEAIMLLSAKILYSIFIIKLKNIFYTKYLKYLFFILTKIFF